eukprot:TRINITY_DN14208_c0_g1_i1.p1 TRINITY_DN14208_c0_g1~~TRINITY_DN14208_c0_g1_i1.p1  ORF type:complete len:159 (-),score=24.56 TRINITY_DN14208_c0_g1_i1:4-480(-)
MKVQNQEAYSNYQQDKQLPYMNYEIIVSNLRLKIQPEFVPNYYIKPKLIKQELIDPVIDPNETWRQYIHRVINFEEPPLVERSSLPNELQPQNRFLGRLNSYWNGKSPYSEYTNIDKPIVNKEVQKLKNKSEEYNEPSLKSEELFEIQLQTKRSDLNL